MKLNMSRFYHKAFRSVDVPSFNFRSSNIYIKADDALTLHRHPVAQSTDGIRGLVGYDRGLHLFEITWSSSQRGTHAVVGVSTGKKASALLCCDGAWLLFLKKRENFGSSQKRQT